MSGQNKKLMNSGLEILSMAWFHRGILASVTQIELEKRYSGSALGKFWLLLHPLLLLAIYLFVYAVVFNMHLPGYKGLSYAVFVFCGLIPFIGLSESLSAGTLCIKQNMHLVKNVLLPIEMVPLRTVFASLATQAVGMVILLALLVATSHVSLKILFLPVVLILQVMMLVGLILVLSSLAVALSDVSYFVNLFVLLLMFISPIGFTRDMVPAPFGIVIDINPVSYMIDAYRFILLPEWKVSAASLAIFALISLGTFFAGALFFDRFKGVLVDYE